MVLICSTSKYAEMAAKAKSQINFKDLAISGLRLRRILIGVLIYEIASFMRLSFMRESCSDLCLEIEVRRIPGNEDGVKIAQPYKKLASQALTIRP